ncbi:lipid droplet-associated protein [Prescottella agglutinans]|uniref:Lipid droplet-associated protein n=1 Tax=Prescottella agglutinans TaxID=1644129 RepID=A0A438BJ09_9NOCA|nr:lipid droplet-associated protein [Prescottella agglutinans]RVW10867.1 lipid droplet-associated protein [Prescottella agglutinans]
MIRPPFMARVAAGMAITAYEEALKLPSTAMTLPMTAVSQVLQTTMRVQQSMTALAIKGDQAFCLLDRNEEEPSWAVFDEDRADFDTDGEVDVEAPSEADATERPSSPGRFALYSMNPTEEGDAADRVENPDAAPTTPDVPVPEIAEELDYAALTLAQLRSRLRSLSVEDLTALLEYEERTAARAPFQTMLTNRITSAKAK